MDDDDDNDDDASLWVEQRSKHGKRSVKCGGEKRYMANML